jgi:hypothetical protein
MASKIRPLQIKTTEADRELIALNVALYPGFNSMAEAIRFALKERIVKADPVQLEQARRAVKRARKTTQEAQA